MKKRAPGKSTLRTSLNIILLTVFLFAGTSTSFGQTTDGMIAPDENWCGTQIHYERELAEQGFNRSPNACTPNGSCDNAATRDPWIPDTATSVTVIRMVVHVLANSDGSNPISTVEEVQEHIDTLNSQFAPYKFEFEHTVNFVFNTAWRVLNESAINTMKANTAIKPDSQLNVWVTQVNFGYSFGTFPWSTSRNPLGSTGGIVMGHFHWVGGPYSTFAHEVGHNLGLWHIFHGVDEVSTCGACYEPPNAADGNTLGDFCADTPPGPTRTSCTNASGVDGCSGQPWGYTMPENIMGYTPSSCRTMFSDQQAGRMHCWTNDVLSGWIIGVRFSGTPTIGPVPLTVDFTSQTAKVVSTWDWDFGEGNTSTIANPTHEYTTPGFHTVSLDIQTTDGPYTASYPGYISAYADTIGAEDVEGQANSVVRIDIKAHNYLPVREMTIPIMWDGPFNLGYDSVSYVGLRTEYFEEKNIINFDPNNYRMTLELKASQLGTSPDLAPDTGTVVSLYLTIPSWAKNNSNPIRVDQYLSRIPTFVTPGGSYTPELTVGEVTVTCCKGLTGNVDNDPFDNVDVADATKLIDFLFISGFPIICAEEANIDGSPDGISDISDLTALIDFLFISGTFPQPCL